MVLDNRRKQKIKSNVEVTKLSHLASWYPTFGILDNDGKESSATIEHSIAGAGTGERGEAHLCGEAGGQLDGAAACRL